MAKSGTMFLLQGIRRRRVLKKRYRVETQTQNKSPANVKVWKVKNGLIKRIILSRRIFILIRIVLGNQESFLST